MGSIIYKINKMKIVYLVDQTFLHGGIEKILSQKSNFLVRNNHEVFIITTEQKKKINELRI